MKTPTFSTLDEVILKALTAVQGHPKHDLDLGYRQAIWAALEPQPNTKRMEGVGKKRRLYLAILTARYVFPLWKKVKPNDETVDRLIGKAEQSLLGKGESLEDDYRTGVNLILDILNEGKYEPAIMAGYSGVKTLSVAIWDERFDPASIDYKVTNEQLDSDYADPAFLASEAYANGSIWEEDSNIVKRLAFWEWWLTEAVPTAWRTFSITG